MCWEAAGAGDVDKRDSGESYSRVSSSARPISARVARAVIGREGGCEVSRLSSLSAAALNNSPPDIVPVDDWQSAVREAGLCTVQAVSTISTIS